MANKVYEINKNWSDYDITVAECQLNNYGCIYLDEFGCPIDNTYETDEIFLNDTEKRI